MKQKDEPKQEIGMQCFKTYQCQFWVNLRSWPARVSHSNFRQRLGKQPPLCKYPLLVTTPPTHLLEYHWRGVGLLRMYQQKSIPSSTSPRAYRGLRRLQNSSKRWQPPLKTLQTVAMDL